MADPAFYPHHPPAVELRETHASRVFLAGRLASKVRKPGGFPSLTTGRCSVVARWRYAVEMLRLAEEGAAAALLRARGLRTMTPGASDDGSRPSTPSRRSSPGRARQRVQDASRTSDATADMALAHVRQREDAPSDAAAIRTDRRLREILDALCDELDRRLSAPAPRAEPVRDPP